MLAAKSTTLPHDERVRARAHQIWIEEGCPDGRAVEHWRRAETEISAEGPPAVKKPRVSGSGTTGRSKIAAGAARSPKTAGATTGGGKRGRTKAAAE